MKGVVLLFGCPMAMAGTYIVDINHPQASDNNPGTPDRPFKSINRAVKELKPGDVLLIKAGEYRESVTINVNGTPEKPISIQAFPGDEGKVVIKGSDLFSEWKQLPATLSGALNGSIG
jgi:hypothetical protein